MDNPATLRNEAAGGGPEERATPLTAQPPAARPLEVQRLGPVLTAASGTFTQESNINGPALLAAPSWLPARLGKYYLYFAQHRGDAIWLATADEIAGPWRVHPTPVLTLSDTHYRDHLASPDVIVDPVTRQIRLYFHGGDGTALSEQTESVAVSPDGLTFRMERRDLGEPYWRVFRYEDSWYALVMPGTLLRSDDGFTGFEQAGPILPPSARHSAVAILGDHAFVFYSKIGDCPESILVGRMDLTGPWAQWQVANPATLLMPTEPYEGGNLPVAPSAPGECENPVRELRDPAAYVEDRTIYLPYVGGGERCIAMAAIRVADEQ